MNEMHAVLLLLPILVFLASCDGSAQGQGQGQGGQDSREASSRPASGPAANPDYPLVRIETSEGNILVELDRAKAPKTVENFLAYVRKGHYESTIFHRVIKGFMIQGGGYTANGTQKPATATVVNEADNGLKNVRGTIAMARLPDPHSASAQFFINHSTNAALDHRDKTPRGWGYCVFGKVKDDASMQVVDKIASIPTGRGPLTGSEAATPSRTITIKNVTILP